MTSHFIVEDGSSPLTVAERQRLSSVLSAVSSRTLLHSLARLNQDNDDASLIIATLLDRMTED